METSPNPSSLKETPIASREPATINPNRLSIPFSTRMSAVTTIALFSGICLGLVYGAKTAGLRFRAENAHRLPSSSTGWYLYHKSKNYHIMFGGVKGGLKMGSKVAFWASGFFILEESVDMATGNPDFTSTFVAGIGIAGGFSLWNQLPAVTAARTAKIGAYSGLALGLLRDALSLRRGRRVGYVDFLLGNNRHRKETENRII